MFAAPTQVLSDASTDADPSVVLQSLTSSLQGRIPQASSDVKVTKNTFDHKQQRAATKLLLSALGNSLRQLMPGYKLSDSAPSNRLVPCGQKYKRVRMLPPELKLWEPSPTDPTMVTAAKHFLFDPESNCSIPDFYTSEKFLRLCTSADEGSEAGQGPNLHVEVTPCFLFL